MTNQNDTQTETTQVETNQVETTQVETAQASGTVEKKRKRTSPEDFIRAFQSSNSHKEVAEKLGVSVSAVFTRAKGFRQRGINLKEMERPTTNSLDVDAANALIEELSQ